MRCQLPAQSPGRADDARRAPARAAAGRSVILRTWEPSAAGSVAAAELGGAGPADRALLATSIGHVLPAVARPAEALGLTVYSVPAAARRRRRPRRPRAGPAVPAAGPRADRRPRPRRCGWSPTRPADGAALTARLLTAPTLAVELARRGVTVEVGVLAEAEFWSAYQPIVSLADRSVVAHEALLRGVVDGREVGGGDLFFVAEQAGWLRPAGPHRPRVGHRRRRAVARATTTCSSTSTRPRSTGRRSAWPAPSASCTTPASRPAQLVFEVVESHAIADRGHLVSVLEHYRSLGWRVALDDVGAGWSSLSLLAAVRPDVVKLDKAAGAGAARRRRPHRAQGGDRPGPPARRRRRRRGRGDRAAGRGGHRAGRRPGSGLAVRPARSGREPPAEEPEGRWQPVGRREVSAAPSR